MSQEISVRQMVELVNAHSHLSLLPEIAAGQAALLLETVLAQPRQQEPLRLARHRARVYSQDGTDGIVAEILARIGQAPRRFVEIGAGGGQENNTRLWLEQGWSGVWIEADRGRCAAIRAAWAPELAAGRLVLVEAAVTRENAAALLREAGAPRDLGLLSLDIDMNTSHVWARLADWRPAVAVIEYNPAYSPAISWEVPYDPRATWAGDNRFGASLARLAEIGDLLGYCLVGCDPCGINAYFVRADLVDAERFAAPFSAANHYEPPRFNLLYLGGHRRAERAPSALESAA